MNSSNKIIFYYGLLLLSVLIFFPSKVLALSADGQQHFTPASLTHWVVGSGGNNYALHLESANVDTSDSSAQNGELYSGTDCTCPVTVTYTDPAPANPQNILKIDIYTDSEPRAVEIIATDGTNTVTAPAASDDIIPNCSLAAPVSQNETDANTWETAFINVSSLGAITSIQYIITDDGSMGQFTSGVYFDNLRGDPIVSCFTTTPTATATSSPTSTATNTATDTPIPPDTATNTSTDTPTNTSTVTSTDTSTDTATDTPTDTPTDTATNTGTDTPTNTSTNTATDTPTDTPTDTATDTPTDTPTNTVTNTVTVTSTNTVTNTTTDTVIDTSTNTSTTTATNSPTNTATNSATNTATNTATNSATNTATNTATNSVTNTATNTSTNTALYTATNTSTPTATNSPTNSPTNTPTINSTSTPTNTPTFTPTVTPTVPLLLIIFPPYPNPSFGSPMSFPVQVPAPSTVTMDVFTLAFRKIDSQTTQINGLRTLQWNLKDKVGFQVANGIYYVRISVTGFQFDTKILKVLVLR